MNRTVIDDVTLVPGGGGPSQERAVVVVDADGIVEAIEVRTGSDPERSPQRFLVPAAVDLHLDNVNERSRPRATVELDLAGVVAGLDAECAAAGIGTVCISARCEHSPGKGVLIEKAVELARVVERLAPHLSCDWRLHARVEVTDDRAVGALHDILDASTRVALVSVMEHSTDRTRFGSAEEHRRFYAEDWGLPLDEVDAILAATEAGLDGADERRRQVEVAARQAGVRLASHDDRDAADITAGASIGATIAEFPLSVEAAEAARAHDMVTVLGAPNVVRGRSTSPGNLLAVDAVRAGLCDVLCSDYLPSALQQAPHALAATGVVSLAAAVDLVSVTPATAIGHASPCIEIGAPLTASLGTLVGGTHVGLALWREGRLVFSRSGGGSGVRG